MEPYLILPAVQAVLYLFLIPVALKGHLRKPARGFFALYLLAMVLWCILTIAVRAVTDTGAALVLYRIIVAAGVLLAGFFFHFSARYAANLCKTWVLPLVYCVTAAAAILALAGPVVIGVNPTTEGYYFLEPGSFFPFVVTLTIVVMVMGFVCIGRSIVTADYSRERNRDIYVLTAFVLVITGALCEFLPLRDLPVCPGTIIGTVLFFVIIMAALLRYRPVEIQRLMRIGLTYLIMALILGLIYIGGLFLADFWFTGTLPVWLHAIMLIVFIIVLRLIWDSVQMVVDSLFFRERYVFLKELRKFMLDAYDIRDYLQLGKLLVDLIASSFQAKNVCLLIRNDARVFEAAISAGDEPLSITFNVSDEIFRWFDAGNRILNTRDIETVPRLQTLSDEEKKVIRDFEIDLILPLRPTVAELAGLLLVGRKQSRKMYSEDEMALLVEVAESVATGVENARIHHTESLLIGELQNQDKQKTEFLHSIAHELKTPITSLLSSTELLEEDIDTITPDQRQRIITNIRRSAGSMDRRVNELLDFARSETGSLELKRSPLKLEELLSAVVERMMPVIETRKQVLKLEIQENIPLIYADSDKLEQVVINLLSNASKFSPSECKLNLRAKVSENQVIVEVEDCARVIDENEKEKIFVAYYRGSTAGDDNRNPGLGLGLAIAKRIILLHQGEIRVESLPDKGNIFSFTVPVFHEE